MDIIKTLERGLKNYNSKKIEISGRDYDLYLIPELSEPELNIYEGFLFIEAEDRREFTSIKNYHAPISGYTPRISFILYGEKLLIKDHRKNKHIIRSLNKINKSFVNKIKKTITNPSKTNIDALFDRKDIIEEFYILFQNTRNYLAENIKGISEENKRIEFADDFLMQMMTLWYLQALGFFNNDDKYLITMFRELSQKRLDESGFKSYKEFLEYFFDKIRDNEREQYYEDEHIGRVVVIGPAIFMGSEEEFEIVDIPDKCFYQENITDILLNEDPKKIKTGIPILNLFESRDWIEGDIDEYVLGALYEKLITADVKKKTGSYYTPEEITSFIARETIEPYLLESMETDHTSIESLIENADPNTLISLFNKLRDIKILDPAVGSGHFLESAIDVLVDIYQKLKNRAYELGLKGFEITITDEKGELKNIDLLEIDNEHFNLYLKFFIILSRNIYGVDINPAALKVARARFFLSIAKHFKPSKKDRDVFLRFPNVHFNLREGNSLIGYDSIGKDKIDLFSFSGAQKKDKKYIVDKINVLDELMEYLESCSKGLGLEGDIKRDIDDLNLIFNQDKIKWTDIKRVLSIKEKLVSILIVSLNSRQASAINDLIEKIDKLFYNKFDEKFSKEHGLNIDEVNQTNAFHWILNFPEVFSGKTGFDLIIGNPPYGNILKDIEKKLLKDRHKNLKDISAIFVERCIDLLSNFGNLTFIITAAITYSKDFSSTRNKVYKNFAECYIATFDRDKCRFFEGMTLSVSLIFMKNKGKNSNCKFFTSKMFRETPNLSKIKYSYANDYLLTNSGLSSNEFSKKHRLPKIGENAKILKKVVKTSYNLKDLINSGEKIWIRTSGNYWYNAWNKKPYKSSEIKNLFIKKEFTNLFLIIINSNLYYLWLRIYGDGRHMNSDIMKNFPIPNVDDIKKTSDLLNLFSSKLMKFLFDNFEPEQKRFETSKVKIIIDLIDIVLGRLYSLASDEINYVINYDSVIRKGGKVEGWLFNLMDYYFFDAISEQNQLDYEFLDFLIDEAYHHTNDGTEYPKIITSLKDKIKPLELDKWIILKENMAFDNINEKEELELKINSTNLKSLKITRDLINDLIHHLQ
ncbi:N-6 DNA methylase [Candidatus Bipolaricaulota bacterium]|nr:N-6 DNA methylase [Candidatus Bipolaricaulota bacterium]